MNKVNHVLIVLVVWTAYITISILFFLGSLNVIEEVSLLYRDAPLAGIHGFAEFLTGFAIGGMIMIVLGGGVLFLHVFFESEAFVQTFDLYYHVAAKGRCEPY